MTSLNDEFESVDDYARMGEAKKAALMLSFFGGAVKLAGTGRDIYVDTKTQKALDTVQAFDYMAGNARMEFDDLSPAAQKLVKQEFADRPQELQTLIQQRSPTGTIAKEARATVDDMLSPFGKKDIAVDGADTKVAGTLPVGSVIAPDFTGVVAVEAEMKPRVRNVAEVIQKKTGVKIGFAEYYQNGQKNNAYKGHYDPTTKTMYFRKGDSNAEIIYKTGMHELTHAIENTKHYAYVSNYVLNKKFGGVESDKYKKAIAAKIAEYEKNAATLNEDEARSELIAGSLRETVFASDEDVRRIVEQDYTFAQHVHDWIDSMLYWVKNTFGDMDEKAQLQADLEHAQRKYRLALASAKGERGGSGRNISYDIKMDYRHQVDLALDKKLKSGLSVYMGKATNFLVKCGLDADLPMLMNQSHLRDINHPKSKENRHWHGLRPEIIKQIPNELKNPVMVYDSISPQNATNSICVVTSLKDSDGLPVIVSIRVEGYGKNRYLNVEAIEQTSLGANFVTSAYGREEFFAHIENVLQNDALIYANKNKTHRLFSGSELELLTRLNNLGFDKIIHPSRNIVKSENKNSFSFSSPKSDNAPAGVEDFDVKVNSEVSPELQKQLDDHVFNVQSDGSVRTLAQEKAARAEQAQSNSAPALDKQLTDNPDIAAIVQDSNVKRAEDITFAHTQKLQGKSSMLFKDLPRVLDYACGKIPGLREFWRNRIEVPFALAKASFTSRTRNVLTEYKTAVDKLGIRTVLRTK